MDRALGVRSPARRLLALVVAGVVGAQLFYLASANLALRFVPDWVSSDDIKLEYRSARSWWPGRVTVDQLDLRGHDYNIQFELSVEHASVQVSLFRLFSRQFQASQIRTSGVRFKARHNVRQLEGNERRLQAFPEIAGYAGPALYHGAPPAPVPESHDRRWSVDLSDVQAQVDELWILEYRYLGVAHASGGFMLRPGREFYLQPSTLKFDGGRVTVAATPVTQQLVAVLRSQINAPDLDSAGSSAFLAGIDASFSGHFTGGDVAFLNAYTQPAYELAGSYEGEAEVTIHQGALRHPSRLRVNARGLKLQGADLTLQGSELAFNAASRAAAASSGAQGSVLVSVKGAEYQRHNSGGGGDFKIDANIEGRPHGDVTLSPLTIDLQHVALHDSGAKLEPVRGQVRSRATRWLHQAGQAALQSTFDFELEPASPLLTWFLGDVPATVASVLGSMDAISGRASVYMSSGSSRVELLNVKSGAVQVNGTWQDRESGPVAAFLVRTGLVNLGLSYRAARSSWQLGASDTFVEQAGVP